MSLIVTDPTNITYSQVDNTIVNANTVSNALTAAQWKDLVLNNAVLYGSTPYAIPNLTGALSSQKLIDAIVSYATIDPTAIASAANTILTVGADTAANAKSLLSLANLNGVGESAALRFAITQTTASAILLGNTSATNVYVSFAHSGASGATGPQPIFATGAKAGVTDLVVMYAQSVTAGNEQVIFYT
jgi:hypothetical protein